MRAESSMSQTSKGGAVQEKEMPLYGKEWCLRTWRHYLLGSKFVIKTDNIATSDFQTQKKLSPKQARWQDSLAEFDLVFEYKPGRTNQVADALSRKSELAALRLEGLAAISRLQGTIPDQIKEGLEHDSMARSLMKMASEGKTRRFWVRDGLLYTKGDRLYVPKWGNLRKELIKECHDTRWAGHPGQRRTYALLETAYY